MTPTVEAARAMLFELRAPARLVRHVELVGEAGEELLAALGKHGVELDTDTVRVGIVIHDVGKVAHPSELTERGALHEAEGEALLLERGWPPGLARICRTHAAWSDPSCTLEELLVALADKLWKGKREPELEARVVDIVASGLGVDRWEVFTSLDTCFEQIAASGEDRLARSVQTG